MVRLTANYLEQLHFIQHHNVNHNYRTQFSRYDKDVKNGIMLVSCRDTLDVSHDDEQFEVWFYGRTSYGNYDELNSHMIISTVEELETIMSYIHWC